MSGIPGREIFFSTKARPLSKKHVYCCFGVFFLKITTLCVHTASYAMSLPACQPARAKWHLCGDAIGKFFFLGKPGSNCISHAPDNVRGAMQPHKFTCGSALATAKAATRGPRELLPGHGLRHLTHLAAGPKQHGLYTVHHAAQGLKKTCTPNQEDLFE